MPPPCCQLPSMQLPQPSSLPPPATCPITPRADGGGDCGLLQGRRGGVQDGASHGMPGLRAATPACAAPPTTCTPSAHPAHRSAACSLQAALIPAPRRRTSLPLTRASPPFPPCPPSYRTQLVDVAWARWLKEEEGVVDDITVVAGALICIFIYSRPVAPAVCGCMPCVPSRCMPRARPPPSACGRRPACTREGVAARRPRHASSAGANARRQRCSQAFCASCADDGSPAAPPPCCSEAQPRVSAAAGEHPATLAQPGCLQRSLYIDPRLVCPLPKADWEIDLTAPRPFRRPQPHFQFCTAS